MEWLVASGVAAAAWVMLAVLSGERKARMDQIEIFAAIERQRSIDRSPNSAQTHIPVLTAAPGTHSGRFHP